MGNHLNQASVAAGFRLDKRLVEEALRVRRAEGRGTLLHHVVRFVGDSDDGAVRGDDVLAFRKELPSLEDALAVPLPTLPTLPSPIRPAAHPQSWGGGGVVGPEGGREA